MHYNRFELPSLQSFSEEHNRLAELIILFDKEGMERLDEEEKMLLDQVLLGKCRYTKKEISMMYRIKRVKHMNRLIDENDALRHVQKKLSQYVKGHRIESEKLQLAFKDKTILTPTEIYVNYEHLVRELDRIKAIINALQRK